MPANINADTRLDQTWTNLWWTKEGLLDRIETLLENALRSTLNAFGSAALRNTGISAGNVPLLDGSGRVPASTLPSSIPVGSFTGTFPAARIPNMNVSKIITATPQVSPTIDRIRVAQIPRLPAATVFTSGRVNSALLPGSATTIGSITGTPSIRHFVYTDANREELDGGPIPSGLRNGLNTWNGTGSIRNGVLTVNPVLVTLRLGT